MKNQNSILFSKTINSIRTFLLERKYFEHHLYSTVGYVIDYIDHFELDKALFLRTNSEPDIWQVGAEYEQLFWIGSLFRKELNLSNLHAYEFTLVDFYKAGGSKEETIIIFVSLLNYLEESLALPKLSKLPMRKITFEEFHASAARKLENGWWVVTDYPSDETFYDMLQGDSGHTSKFEIFFVHNDERVEIGTAGQVGPNASTHYKIHGVYKDIDENLTSKKFMGLGFGVERLLLQYAKF